MSRALVIKGSNYNINKLDTVILGDVIPCTALSLSQDAIIFTSIGATIQLLATRTPNDTTDIVQWSTSNEDVATVRNGLVTCVGVGSATITATCGLITATCSVVSTVTLDCANMASITPCGINGANLSADPPRDYVGANTGSNSRYGVFCDDENTLEGYKLFSQDAEALNGYYPYPMPENTTKITITQSVASFFAGPDLLLTSSQEARTYEISTPDSAKLIARINDVTSSDTYNFVYDIRDVHGADSLAICLHTASSSTTFAGYSGTLSVKFE